MGMLTPAGVVLITMGLAGTAASCFGSGALDRNDLKERTGTSADATPTGQSRVLAPIAGLLLASGVACVGIGVGHWRRPVLSATRPANPWSDQPGTHGDPPKGLV